MRMACQALLWIGKMDEGRCGKRGKNGGGVKERARNGGEIPGFRGVNQSSVPYLGTQHTPEIDSTEFNPTTLVLRIIRDCMQLIIKHWCAYVQGVFNIYHHF